MDFRSSVGQIAIACPTTRAPMVIIFPLPLPFSHTPKNKTTNKPD